MSKYKLIITPKAEDDIKEARIYYNKQKENLGNEFVAEIKHTVHRIEQNPAQFPVYKHTIRRALTRRFPLDILYFVKDTLINVFAILHLSRNPKQTDNRFEDK